MRLFYFIALSALLSLFSLNASADEKSVKALMEEKIGPGKVESVTKMPYLGLYEIYFDGHILYTDEKVSYIINGNIFDAKNNRNLTGERMQKLSAIKFDSLPLDKAVKIVRGNGKRVFAMFEDPNCGYCKKIEKDIANLTDVTIYIFLYPILSPDSHEKSKAVWCSSDRAKAWIDLMVNGTPPKGTETCETPIEEILALGRKLKINGTPTIFFKNGQRVPGAIPVAQLEQALNENVIKSKSDKNNSDKNAPTKSSADKP